MTADREYRKRLAVCARNNTESQPSSPINASARWKTPNDLPVGLHEHANAVDKELGVIARVFRASMVSRSENIRQLGRLAAVSQGRLARLPPGTGLVYRRPPPWPQSVPYDKARDSSEMNSERRGMNVEEWQVLPKEPLELEKVPTEHDPRAVPTLAHGLDKILNARGVHPMQPMRRMRGRGSAPVVNLDVPLDSIRNIPQPDEIDWRNIPPYVPASRDTSLRDIALTLPCVRYTGSTSSTTSVLSSLCHAVSNFKDTRLLGGLTSSVSELPRTFTKIHRRPTAVLLRPYPRRENEPQVFTIDSHSGPDTTPAILRDLGHSLERMLTMPNGEFREKMILRDLEEIARRKQMPMNASICDSIPDTERDRDTSPHFYHYSIADSLLVRAQIDCRDEHTGSVFDLKTRAVAPIRYNLANYMENTHRYLKSLTGAHDSYEREFYDMVRSVFLKYALQLRLGRMAGAFVAYHNTSQLLGFEYVPLDEIEAYTFGSATLTKHVFSSATRLLQRIMDAASETLEVGAPDYLKLVFVSHASQRRVDIYAQRVCKADGDPLGPERFSSTTEHMRTRRQSDSGKLGSMDIPAGGRSGVALVSSDILDTDLAKLESLSSHELRDTRPVDFRESVANSVRGQLDAEGADIVRFNLKLSPVVNGVAVSRAFELNPEDSFELRYSLRKDDEDPARILADYIGALSLTYYPTDV